MWYVVNTFPSLELSNLIIVVELKLWLSVDPLLILNLLVRKCPEADPRFLNLMGSTLKVLINCVGRSTFNLLVLNLLAHMLLLEVRSCPCATPPTVSLGAGAELHSPNGFNYCVNRIKPNISYMCKNIVESLYIREASKGSTQIALDLKFDILEFL